MQIASDARKPTALDRILSLFAEIGAGEGATALLLMSNVFILLTAYYIIKPVREALILGESGAEIKSYASAGQAALFLIIIPLYGALARRVNRVWLINGVIAIFIANLLLFFALGTLGFSFGVVFYLWAGLFNVMLIAQFWAFANDIYTQAKGERLFGILGIGAAVGAIFGAFLAGLIFEPVGPYRMMLLSASLLGISMILTNWTHHRESGLISGESAPMEKRVEAPKLGSSGGFQLILNSRYLLMIALLVFISNCVNTTGEFILGKTVAAEAEATVLESGNTADDAVTNYIGQFYSDFFFWVNLCGAIFQMFFVSRIMQRFGTGRALLFLPVLAMGAYSLLALIPILGLIRIAKIAENSADYSIQNTARHALFLPTSREAKYKAKAAVDTFFWRAGDSLSGLLVYIGTQLALSPRVFAGANVVLVVIWLSIAVAIIRLLKRGLPDPGNAV